MTGDHLPTRAGNDRRQVEPVRRTVASVVLHEPVSTPLQEPLSSDTVTAGGMGEANTDLGQTLPQVTFGVRPSLPTRLQDLMRGEGPSLSDKTASHVHGL